jgi:polyphosphate:AMP phosphotransferase
LFETAELGRKLPKPDFETLEPRLRLELLDLQQRLRHANFPVILVFAGVDAAGKSETVNLLNQWMDPRFIVTRAYNQPSDEERERPEMWRYWVATPPHGRIGMFQSSWYSRPVLDRVFERASVAEFDQQLARIATFEKLLADDGALILKFWMHMSKEAQKKRFQQLEKDPLEAWRVGPEAWDHWERYDRFVAAAERAITHTSGGHAPWHVIEGVDHRYRSVAVATRIRDALAFRLDRERVRAAAREVAADTDARPAAAPANHQPTVLSALDATRSLTRKDYREQLRAEQARLAMLQREARRRGTSSVLVFEGWDAAGKGGAIKRLADAWDARDVRMHPIAAPTDEERVHHYLWRFWTRLPRAGHVAVFDRSWYGRVLVERVEGFATELQWWRAYSEIRHFEEQIVAHGTCLVKLWLHITPEEQLARFESRKDTPWKAWKLTDEDWRNRDKWPAYDQAVHDMVERTSTADAPWTLVEANDKNWARVKVVRTVADALERTLRG